MKKVFSLCLLVVASMGMLFAQSDVKADFSSVATSGQVLYYKIIDYGEVHVWPHSDNPELLGGYIKIPRTVKFEGQNYIVTGIGDNAFAFCIRIQGIELPTTMFFIGDRAFEGCTSLIDVVMPNSVIEMGANVFKDCDNVRHFVISQGLTEIPEGAFMNCKSVTDYFIPASVTALGCNAFDGYVNLKTVTFFGNIPPEPECEPAFGREIPIYVKSQAFDQYKASYHWGQYAIKAM